MKINLRLGRLPSLILFLVFALTTISKAQVVTGVDSLKKVSGVWEYYDFTSSKAFTIADTTTYTPDFWGSSNEGINFGKEFSSFIPGKRLYLLGTGNIDTVKTVPSWTDAAPWVDTSWDFSNGTGGQPISPGQLWVVYTSEGLYSVMQIDELPDGNFGDSFTFKFKYMSEGGTNLEETNLNNEPLGNEIAGSATSTSGTGFDFSRQQTGDNNDAGDYQLDFAFVNNEGVNFGNEGSTSLSGTGRRFILLGNGNIDSLTSVPSRTDTAPWVTVSYDFSNGTQGQPISVGQLWGVYTREGNYAAIEIIALPGGNFGSSFDFKYKYQPDGSRFFEGSDVIEPDPVLAIAIESGNNQTANLSSQAANPIVVLITNQDDELVSGEAVNFAITNDPIGVNEEGTVTASSVSNSSGLAEATVTVGDKEGTYTIKATLASDESKFVEFTINAEAEVTGPQPTTLVIAGGQNQITVLGDTIASSFEIIVLDDIGEPMNGITVTFEEQSIPEDASSGKFFSPDGISTNQAVTFNNRAYMDYSTGNAQGDYLIKAFLGNFPSVDSVVFTVSGELVKAPLGFLATANGPVVDLTWDKAEGANEYKIYRAINDDNPASASLLSTISRTEFTDDNVVGGETYFYQVFSVDIFGNESQQSAGPLSATPVEAGDIEMGSATIMKEDNVWQYFDFSAGFTSDIGQNDDYLADFRGTSNEGVNFGREGAPFIEGNRIIRLSGEGLASINEIPAWTNEAPWIGTSWEFSNGTGGQPIQVGELWGVYTSEGHYAAMEITDVPEAFGSSFSFSYKYQPSGSNQFGDVVPVIPDTLILVSGDNQIGNPNILLSQAFIVEVQDENGDKLEGVTVNFDVTTFPSGSMSFGLSTNSVITNSSGQARVFFTLGDQLGEYEVSASVEGLNSVVFNSTAIEVQPPESVTLLEIRDGFRPNSLIPQWTQSKSENFLYYRVYISTEGGDLELIDSTRVGASFIQDTSAFIGELTALQEYTFAVSVVNADGQESELSNRLTSFPKPTPEVPTNVVALAGDGAVQLSWDANDSTYFDFYYVYSGVDGGSILPNDTLYSAMDTSLVIDGLENDQTYQFYVIAVNTFGKESSFPQKITATPTSSLVEEETTLPSLINGASSWADIDNDGDLDLVMTGQVAENSAPKSFLFLNDGDGNFNNANADIIGVINSAVYWYDIDRNGYVDLVISGDSEAGSISKVYLNEEGTLTDAGFTLPGLGDGMIAPGDYDSDGDLDFLIAGNDGSGPQTILIQNTGNGTFLPLEFPFVGFTKAAASWGDYDGDGRLDFLISGEIEGGSIITMIYKNTGNGTFLVSESSLQGVINGTVSLTDLDLDTDLDILITGFTNLEKTSTFTGLYRNTGLDFELFYSATNPLSKAVAIASKSQKAVLGDYDNDGDPDVLISSSGSASILKNNRDFVTEEVLDLGIEGSVTWADYDGDGDLDIIATGSGADGASSKILANVTSIKNTAPTAPTALMTEVLMDTVLLSWESSTDAQTPSRALTYNIRIGSSPGTSDILSANADLVSGRLRIQANGNAGFNTEYLIRDLPNGTYFWQVQAVDNSFLGSKFSEESEFTLDNSLVSNEDFSTLPLELELLQNYPNPFNPSTNIEFSVPENGLVKLEVFDITGRLVDLLVNDQKSAGAYSVRFDARNLASGLYIYRIQIGSKILTKKMTLIK
ncbi:MAG: hypothetical protein BalsKO_22950 [Balneolaceae bacterium]